MIIIDVLQFQIQNCDLDLNLYSSIFDDYWYDWVKERNLSQELFIFGITQSGSSRKLNYYVTHSNILALKYLKFIFRNPEDEVFFKLGFY